MPDKKEGPTERATSDLAERLRTPPPPVWLRFTIDTEKPIPSGCYRLRREGSSKWEGGVIVTAKELGRLMEESTGVLAAHNHHVHYYTLSCDCCRICGGLGDG